MLFKKENLEPEKEEDQASMEELENIPEEKDLKEEQEEEETFQAHSKGKEKLQLQVIQDEFKDSKKQLEENENNQIIIIAFMIIIY